MEHFGIFHFSLPSFPVYLLVSLSRVSLTLNFDMSVKSDKFLKNNPENIEILSSVGTFLNDVNW